MKYLRSWKTALAALLIVTVVVVATQYRHLVALGYYTAVITSQRAGSAEPLLKLANYIVTVEARPVVGIENNLSGLTFNPLTGSLFAVINGPPAIVELSLEGALLRHLPLKGARDPEGISHVRDHLFVVSDEQGQQIYWLDIQPDTETLEVDPARRLVLHLNARHNRGFEGISWDDRHERLYVVQEQSPLRVVKISGLSGVLEQSAFNLQIKDWKTPDAFTLFMTDMSSITIHEDTGSVIILSDESARIVEYSPEGRPLSMMSLRRGRHGLTQSVPQAEGIAIGPERDIYVVSEPNLFYQFKTSAAH